MEKNYHIYAAREAELYYAVGCAISKWAKLEFQLLEVFAAALRIELKTAASLFRHVKTFSLALDMTDDAVKAKPGMQTGRAWTTLVDYIRELSGDRNYLAHTAIVAHGKGTPEGVDWAEAMPFVGPSIVGHIIGQTRFEPIGLEEALELVADMQQAIDLTMDFRNLLVNADASPDKYDEPIVRRRPPRKQRREDAGKAQPVPPQSSEA